MKRSLVMLSVLALSTLHTETNAEDRRSSREPARSMPSAETFALHQLGPNANQIAQGVWRIETPVGYEIIAIGEEGLHWRRGEIARELEVLYAQDDALPGLQDQIEALENYNIDLSTNVETASATACSSGTLSWNVQASPLNPGAYGLGYASYSSSSTNGCLASGSAYAVSTVNGYTKALYSSASNKTSFTLSASASLSGSGTCYSRGDAYISAPYISVSKVNTSCGTSSSSGGNGGGACGGNGTMCP